MRTVAAILPYAQIILAVILVVLVLVQRSDADLGALGGSDGQNGAAYTRRGAERLIFNLTIIVGIVFAAAALAAFIVR